MEEVALSTRAIRRQHQTATDDGAIDLRTGYDDHIVKHGEWQEGPWFSGMHILRDQSKSVLCAWRKSSATHISDPLYENGSLKDGVLEEFDMDESDYNCSGSTHPLDQFKPISIQQLSRPPMVRSYGSSSASSASTLMTPRDAHSWTSSAQSPAFIEATESIPTSNPYHLHILPATKLAKDMSYGDFPTSREFRFPSNTKSASPEPPALEWLLDDHTEVVISPLCSYQDRDEPKRSKKSRAARNYQRDSKQIHSAFRGIALPGLGVISHDGSYNEGSTFISKLRARHGPLTPEQRHDAALMRRHGACRDCRRRKIKCQIRHRSAGTDSLSSTPPPRERLLSIQSVTLTVLVLRRCINRRYLKLLILPDISDIPISEQISRQASCFENMTLQDLDLQSLFVRSQMTTESSEANSINSFEDDLTEYSREGSAFLHMGQSQDAGSEELLAAIQPLLDRLPDGIASSLSNELLSLFGIWFGNQPPYRQVLCDGSSSPSNSQNRPGNTPTPTNSTGSVPKRLSDDGSEYSDPSGNGGDGKRKRPRNVSQTLSGPMRRWACPYYQRDPHFYCVAGDFGDYRKCSRSPGFSEVHRVKQHLYDCHAAIYCTRCYSQFKRKEELVDHHRRAVSCEVRDPLPLQGLNEDQRELLKPRDRNKSEDERWKTVYKICFPTDQVIPSPYYVHYTRETALLRREILQIVEEETVFMDGMIRERLLGRLQIAFDNNAQNSGSSQSPVWSPQITDLMSNGNMPSATFPISNAGPWSEWEIRHTNPEDVGHAGSAETRPILSNSDGHFIGPGLDLPFLLNNIPSFEYDFRTGGEINGMGFDENE